MKYVVILAFVQMQVGLFCINTEYAILMFIRQRYIYIGEKRIMAAAFCHYLKDG